ncbi:MULTISPECIES: putative Ig domain-containing protein [Hyphomicrobiales]|uniref:putative Ig domain-containing protein n=1 Tax=Methylobacterium sp. CCH7-A2 TaxID=1768789 RepID=UPI000B1821A4|nr:MULTISPECIES: putative Ig domain-containing protein [Hyphomicrobiales]
MTVAAGTAIDTFGTIDTLIGIEDIRGTTRADYLVGNDEANLLHGRAGDDYLRGNGNFDDFIGGAGTDILDGTDVVDDADPTDTVFAQFSSDDPLASGVIVNFGDAAVTVGAETVAGHRTRDAYGSTDTLIDIEIARGTYNADHLYGGDTGNDDYEGFEGLAGNDVIDGGSGFDEVRYTNDAGYQNAAGQLGTQGVVVNLSTTARTVDLDGAGPGAPIVVAAGTARDGYGDTDTLTSIEGVRATNANDWIFGGAGDERFRLFAGADVVDGGGGTDQVDYRREWTGGNGVTVVLGGTVAVNGVTAGTARDVSGAIDTLISIEDIRGTDGSDAIIGDNAANLLRGEGGGDNLTGNGGNDTLHGGAGFDRANYGNESGGIPGRGVIVNLSASVITADIGAGSTVVAAASAIDTYGATDTLISIENVRGTSNADHIVGDGQSNTIFSRGGADIVIGGAGSDFLHGGGGADTLDGSVPGGDGFDVDTAFYQSDLTDTLTTGIHVNLSGVAVTLTDPVPGIGTITIAAHSAKDPLYTGAASEAVDTLIDIEAVRGTMLSDVLIGGDSQNDAYESFEGLGGDDYIDGGSGFDEVGYANGSSVGGTQGATVNLSATDRVVNGITVAAQTAQDGFGGIDRLVSIEAARGSSFADTLIGGDGAERFSGLAGADVIDGGGGIDTVSYLFDANFGGQQGVQVNLSAVAVGTMAAGTARDGFGTIDTLVSIENVQGTFFADSLIGSSEANAFTGFGGNDFISGGDFASPSNPGGDVNDRVFYSGTRSDYSIARSGNGPSYTVTDLRAGSPDGSDFVVNVEYLHFTDQTLDLRQAFNRAPTDITLFGSQVQENMPGFAVGGLNVSDPDFETVFTFTVSDARFEIANPGFYQLKLKAGVTLDHETEPTVTFDVTATDLWGGSFTKSLMLDVQNMNDAPIVASPIPDQVATVGQPFSYVIPASTFSDQDGNTLALFVQNMPGWMSYDPVTRTLSGTPTPGAPSTTLTVLANDGAGGQASDSFQLTVSGPAINQMPVIVTPIPDQVARIGQAFSYTIPAGAYVDPEGQPLTITASAPAPWLSYDPATRTISGTPPVGSSTVTVNVMISDGSGGLASDRFNLSVGSPGQDLPPTLQSEVLNQFVTVGQPFSYTIPADAYFDPEGQPLTLTLVGQPAWLSFDPVTRTMSGTPPADFLQASLAVSVSDGVNPPVTDGFTVTRAGYLNQMPAIVTPIPDQVARIGEPFSYTIPAGAYVDPEGQPLAISVIAPAHWLSYDAATRTISGTPPAGTMTFSVSVNVSDGFGGIALDSFNLSVGSVGQDLPPTFQSEVLNQFVTVGQPFSYTIPANAYFDPEGQPLTLTLAGQPAWLSFDPVTRTMSGTPPADFLQASLAVLVSDGVNPLVVDGFTLQRAGYFNQSPMIAAPIPDQVATIGQPFSYTIPAGAYVDPEGQPLTINVMAPTAGWLSYDPATRTISGTPPAGSSTVSLHVSVSDGFGGIASDFFNLSVGSAPTNQAPTAIALSGTDVPENVSFAQIGTVVVTDADSTSFTFQLSDPRVEIIGGPGNYVLRVKEETVFIAEDTPTFPLTITATDAQGGSFSQTFVITVNNIVVAGTNDNDNIVGDDSSQTINGLDGNDYIFGRGGDDTLYGDAGDDILIGEAGNDSLFGGTGFDHANIHVPFGTQPLSYSVSGAIATVTGSSGPLFAIERLAGGTYEVRDLRPGAPAGVDTLAADIEAFTVVIDPENPGPFPFDALTLRLQPSAQPGYIAGSVFGETLDVMALMPTVDADTPVSVDAGDGDDAITGHAGSNFITGGAGDDEISGGGGFDTASYALPAGTAGTLSSVTTGNVTLVRLTDGATVTDVFRVTASGASVTVEDLRPGSPLGTDIVHIGSGPSFETELLAFAISGVGNGPPVQTLYLNIAPQAFSNAGGGFIQGGIGADTISATVFFASAGAADAIGINGGSGDDVITGHAGSNFITGGAGDDVISGGGGIDSAAFMLPLGTPGTLSSVTAGAVTLVKLAEGAATTDVFRITQTASGWTVEDLRPGSPLGTDTLDQTVENLSIGIEGSPGQPPVQSLFLNLTPQFFPNGNGGFVQGGIGSDVVSVATLAPAAGATDVVGVNGGSGDDIITGHGGANFIEGGAGNDAIAGGGGRDVAQYILPSGTAGFIGAVRDDDDVVRLTLNDNGSVSDLFSIVRNGNGTWTVTDLRPGAPLGTDTLAADVEQISVFVPSSPAAIVVNLVPLTEIANGVTSVFGSIEPDVLTASGPSNSQINLFGNLGNDTLTGHGGTNYLNGGPGRDVLDGAGGNDTLVGGGGADQINGGAGSDLVNYGDETGVTGVVVNLSGAAVTVDGTVFAARTARDSYGQTDTLSGIENIRGTTFADTLIGDNLENDLQGGSGNDTLIGNGASDGFNGGAGDDLIDGTAVPGDSDDTDQVYYQFTNETVATGVRVNLSGNAVTHLDGGVIAARSGQDSYGGVDTLIDIEVVRGTNLADVLYGGDNGNADFEGFRGLGGADYIDGGAGFDEARYDRDAQFGGTASVVVNLSGSSRTVDRDGAGPQAPVTVAAGSAIDGFGTIDTLVGIEAARGTVQADVFIGGGEDNAFMGLSGADSFDGGGGTDTVRYDQEFNNGGAPVGVRVNLSGTVQTLGGTVVAAGTAIDSFGATDSLTSIETIRGTRFDDIVHGGNAGETLRGEGGNDVFYGNGGIDTLRLNGNRVDYSVTAIAPGRFEVVDLRTGSPDGTDTIYDVERIRFLDGTVDISVPEAAPTDITVTGPLSVQDTSGAGTTVATFGVVDAGDLGPHIYTLVGGATDRFAIAGDRLVVAAGASFDAENEPVISVTVRVTDPSGLSYDETFTVTVGSRSLGGSGNDTLTGTGGADRLFGQGGNDILIGLDGDDALNGGTGADEMQGGAGNDSYTVDDAGDQAIETVGGVDAGGLDRVTASVSFTLGDFVENLTLTGTADIDGTGNGLDNRLLGNAGANVLDGLDGEDTLYGYGGSDTLRGGAGNDRLDAGTGADLMAGGAGDDTYYVDDALDLVSEDDGQGGDAGGLDLVMATTSTVLAVHVEDLRLLGSEAIDGTGNDDANTLLGNNAANRLVGRGGADTLNGYGGNDILEGGDGEDILTGGDGDDTLRGGADADVLRGGTGFDAMFGGAGDDVYYVDDLGDTVSEDDGSGGDAGGFDTVYTTVDLTAAEGIEIIRASGGAALSLTGNDGANTLLGNAAANILDGAGGDDTLNGGAGSDTLRGGDDDDRLLGGDDADQLFGGAGDDRLDGGAGADWMNGGSGNDTYYVNDLGDVVSEDDGSGGDAGGFDVVFSSVDMTLSAGIENLSLTGAAAVNGTGNGLDNRLLGNNAANLLIGADGADQLVGNGGNDTLIGGGGSDNLNGGAGMDRLIGGLARDILTGGADADTFVFEALPDTRDTITDFQSGLDKIEIASAAFGGGLVAGGSVNLAVNGPLAAGVAGFTYSTTSGALAWDADGQGGAAAVAVAVLTTKPLLTASDFQLV